MATTPAGNPYIESSDLVANYPATSLALANRLDKYAVNPFTDATARDAAIPTPVQGQLAQTLDDNKVWRYDGTAWAPFSGAPGGASFTNTPTGTYTDGGIDYKYITFTGTGNFEVDVAGFADVLVVAGGGYSYAGGAGPYRTAGGAGGVIYSPNKFLALGTNSVVVGAGGASYSNGDDSVFIDLYAIGGAHGNSSNSYVTGFNGGSGSGASGVGVAVGLGVIGQGHDGGISASGIGAGGGAGGAASGATPGPGLFNSITGAGVTYAVGGSASTPNTANSGNGGGGVANGSSGVVIIRVVV